MDETTAEKIVNKVTTDTLEELSDYFKFWFRSYRSSGISLTQEFSMDHIPEIMEKKVSELNDHEKLILFIHLFIGDDYSPYEPDQELPETEAEKNCILTAYAFMKLFAETHGKVINELFNKEDKVPLLKMEHYGDLSKSELLVLLANTNWDN